MEALPYFITLLLTLPIGACIMIPSNYLQVLRKQKFLFYLDAMKMTLRIPLQLLLLPLLGLWGMVFDRLFLTVLSFVMSLIYFARMKKELPIEWGRFLSFGHEDRMFLKMIYERTVSTFGQKLVKRKG